MQVFQTRGTRVSSDGAFTRIIVFLIVSDEQMQGFQTRGIRVSSDGAFIR